MEYEINQPDLPDLVELSSDNIANDNIANDNIANNTIENDNIANNTTASPKQPKQLNPVDFIPDSIDVINQLNRIINNTVSSTISTNKSDKNQESPKVEILNEFKQAPIVDIPISNEFAGIIFFTTQLISRGEMTQLQGANLIRQFYEFDTGKYLQPKEIKSLLWHEKVKQYEKSIMPNIEAKYKRRTLLEEAEREMLEKSKVSEVKTEEKVEEKVEVVKETSELVKVKVEEKIEVFEPAKEEILNEPQEELYND